MKRIVQVCAIILVFSLVLGLVGCLMGGRPQSVRLGSAWLSRLDFNRDNATAASSLQVLEEPVTALEFDLGGAEVTICGGDAFSVEVTRGTLVKNQVKNGVWTLENGMKDLTGAEIRVTVPRQQVLERLDLKVGAGQLNLEDLHCQTADFEVGVGALIATGVTVEQSTDIAVDLGKVQLDGSLLGKTSVQCEMGEVTLTLEKPDEYGYRIASDLGIVSVDGQSYSGMENALEAMTGAANFYEIDCDLGSVKLDFH